METEINAAYLLISVICYIAVEAIKTTPIKSQLYPLVALVLGGLLGGLGNRFLPELVLASGTAQAVLFGALCGLAATGGDQIYKQLCELLGSKKAQ